MAIVECCLGPRRTRQIQRAARNCKLTFLYLFLFLTVVVFLRGTLGTGKFGTLGQDFDEIRSRLQSRRFSLPHRALVEDSSSSGSKLHGSAASNGDDDNPSG